ncbi:MAG: beta-Ala-His dipeptidase [Clostridia bacterium]|nr:beta-Ala-His dipeptidase [Clostridia bacterium]
MARILENIHPERVWFYFESICSIPHGSGHTAKLANYLCFFAKMHGLSYTRDKANNVIIRKDASPGCSRSEGVILQGHIDMVCAKKPDSDHDFEKDGLKLMTDGENVFADGTSLGGDDGIAVAIMLAILESDAIRHPAIEAVFTSDEEIGMVGAKQLDMRQLKHRIMLNLDSETEGILTVSCAGGSHTAVNFPVRRAAAARPAFRVTVSGLLGGHSGSEIHRGLANAAVLAGRFLKDGGLDLVSINGGEADNAIMTSCVLVVCGEDVRAKAEKEEALFRKEFPNESIRLTVEDEAPACPADLDLGGFLTQAPYGVQAWSRDIPGLVQTSLNVGIVRTGDASIELEYSVRSSVNREKEELNGKLKALAARFGGSATIDGEYPAWEFRKKSELQERMVRVYEELFGKRLKTEAIHAGLECGLFADALHGLDAVSYGPDMYAIHTADEKLSLNSVEHIWTFTLAVLEDLCPPLEENAY